MQIVKVKFESDAESGNKREYSYYTEDELTVGELIKAPTKYGEATARVTAVDIPELEIARFKDAMRTIPAGSLVKEEQKSEPLKDYRAPEPLSDEARAIITQGRDTMMGRTPEDAEKKVFNWEWEPSELVLEPVPTAVVKVSPGLDPAFLALQGQITGIRQYSEGRIIRSDTDVKPATDDLTLIGQVMKAVEDLRKSYVGPLNDHVKAINAVFKQLSDPLDQANQVTRQKIMEYRSETERRRREAEEINRQKEELARREAALNEGEFTVDTTPVAVPEAPPAHVRTDTGTLGTMKVRKWEVVDIKQVPDDYKIIDAAKITKVVKAGLRNIPGIKIYCDETIRVNTR